MLTADEGLRAKKVIKLKQVVDDALKAECECVTACMVYKRTGNTINWVEGRDVWMHEAMAKEVRRPHTGQSNRGAPGARLLC